MTTTAQNNELRAATGRTIQHAVKTDGTADINQGDQVYMDTSAHVVKVIATNGNAATFAGVAAETSYVNPYGTKVYTDSGTIPVRTDGTFLFKSTNGETYTDGNAVYLGADAQTISNVDPGSGNKIGYVELAAGQASIAGDGTVTVPVVITPLWPVTGGI